MHNLFKTAADWPVIVNEGETLTILSYIITPIGKLYGVSPNQFYCKVRAMVWLNYNGEKSKVTTVGGVRVEYREMVGEVDNLNL